MKKHCFISTLVFYFYTIIGFGQTPSFHDTKGELSISNSGTANYTIPIALPPSINNLAPSINLTYNSGSRGGIAGQGWSISTISSITRMSTRRDIDGFVDGVDFDDNDKLALDGQRLILKSGTYWANGSTYETEFKSNLKVELVIYTAVQILGNTRSFIVTQPDGSRSWYGNRVGDPIAMSRSSRNAWYITRHEDIYGNSINYEYSVYNSSSFANSDNLYIHKIHFSGNESQSIGHVNYIQFNYIEAARTEKDFLTIKTISGNLGATTPSYATQIVSNITVYSQSTVFKKYQLSHSIDSDGYQRVTQVQEINGQNEASNPVLFSYNPTDSETPIPNHKRLEQLQPTAAELTGDFDGDNNMDFIAYNQVYLKDFVTTNPISAPNNYKFAINTLTNNKKNQFQSILSIVESNTSIEYKTYNLVNNQFLNTNNKIINLNRNGIHSCTLYISGSPDTMPCYDFYNLSCQNDNNPFIQYVKHFVGDFNGDGISEVLIEKEGSQQRTINISNQCNPVTDQTNGGTSSFYILDLNPNESTTLGSNGFMNLNFPSNLKFVDIKQIADFNGDGRDDILFMNGKNYYIYEVNKSETQTNTTLLGQGILDYFSVDKPLLYGDFNADGKLDVLIPHAKDATNWSIYYSNPKPTLGAFFDDTTINGPIFRTTDQDNGCFLCIYYSENSNCYTMDTNKDGKTDLITIRRRVFQNTWGDPDRDNFYDITSYTNKIGKSGSNNFEANWISGPQNSGTPAQRTIIVGNFQLNKTNADIIMWDWPNFNNFNTTFYKFEKDFQKDN